MHLVGFPEWLAHALRVAVVMASPVVIWMCVRYAWRVRDLGQKARFYGLGFAMMSAAYTEIYRFNSVVTPRLFLNVAAVAFSLYGLWRMQVSR